MTFEIELQSLKNELDEWSRTETMATIWWRDDDLHQPTAELDLILNTSEITSFKPLLGVIPLLCSQGLSASVKNFNLRIAVHGLLHVNHNSHLDRKSEFGGARYIEDQKRDVKKAKDALTSLFGDSVLNCFIPPWNRISSELVSYLPDLGFSSISTFGDRKTEYPAPNLLQINTHVDLIDWKKSRKFIGGKSMTTQLTNCLRYKRSKELGHFEPIGLLSHHLKMNKKDWEDFETVCFILKNHTAAYLADPNELFR